MPLYDWFCKCGYENEHIANIDEQLPCPNCNSPMTKILSCGRFAGVRSEGYYDDTLGAFIDSNSTKRRLMADQCVSECNRINTRVSDRGRWI